MSNTQGESSVSNFLSKFKAGFAKPNRYRVEFFLPPGVSASSNFVSSTNSYASDNSLVKVGNAANGNQQVNIACHTMTMPQRSLMTYEIKQNFAPVRLPYSATYDPVTFSFYADNRYTQRDFFDVWQGAVTNIGSNTMNFYKEYVSDIKMFAQDDAGRDTYSVTLFDAYPLNIGLVDFSYAQANNFQTITVTMSFKAWAPSWNSAALGSGVTNPSPYSIIADIGKVKNEIDDPLNAYRNNFDPLDAFR